MVTSTKTVKKIAIPKNMKNKLFLTRQLEKYYEELFRLLEDIVGKNEWVEVNGGVYYYIHEDGLIIPNPKKVRLDASRFIILANLDSIPMQEWIATKWFYQKKENNPIIENDRIYYTDIYGNKYESYCVFCGNTNRHKKISDGVDFDWSITDADGIKIPIYQLSKEEKEAILFFFLSKHFNVFTDERLINFFSVFAYLQEREILIQSDSNHSIVIKDFETYQDVCEKLSNIGLPFNPEEPDLFTKLFGENFCLSVDLLNEIKGSMLASDRLRVNMETYPEHILQDPESGHWELWDEEDTDFMVELPESLVARNPVYDALSNKSGVVGIDFGTKSTVVMYRQSRADILPMRIGSGQFSRVVSKNDYENPTVMELRNVKKFMEDYGKGKGRPTTYWEDLLISHEAAEQLKSEQSRGDTFASFFSELKQWASDKTRQARLRDLQGNELNITSYLSLTEDDFDPIEIYAYYLGLFINNMIHKVIYLRYKLSFPATVEKQVRDKILESFTRGIKKSLPVQVLEDEECMNIFKVEQGASEPAAYAITALSEYGFDPEDEEKFYYGIFDFGGGTTDFDFGVWSAEEEEPENYDYQISHFGQGGDPYLGGENLLEVLAYHVFIQNYDKLLEDKIVFIRPSGERLIAGKDYLICQDSQYARFNQKRMMEKLRGVWENDEEIRESFRAGSITLPVFTMDGESKNNYSFEVDIEELDQLLESRIEKGVSQFFNALKNCFGVNHNQKDIHDVEHINIFLAGNSSKSPMVYKIFKKYIDLYKEGLLEREGQDKEWFRIYPPLGTHLSEGILKGKMNPLVDEILSYLHKEEGEETDEKDGFHFSSLNKPTGKTGVAYGLLNSRVRVVQNEEEEIGFRYFIGQNRKNRFYCVIDKDTKPYHEWTRFCTASREDFEIWFTRSAAAPTNKLPIDQTGVYSEIGFVEETTSEKSVYIRLVSPTDIEYVIADEEEIERSSFKESEVTRVSLQEKE